VKVIVTEARDMNFAARDGKPIDGVTLHFNHLDPDTFGRASGSQFIQRHIFDSLGVTFNELKEIFGAEVELDFNTKGKIVGLTV